MLKHDARLSIDYIAIVAIVLALLGHHVLSCVSSQQE